MIYGKKNEGHGAFKRVKSLRSSLKVSDESLGRDETYVCKASHMIMHCEILTLFQVLKAIVYSYCRVIG